MEAEAVPSVPSPGCQVPALGKWLHASEPNDGAFRVALAVQSEWQGPGVLRGRLRSLQPPPRTSIRPQFRC